MIKIGRLVEDIVLGLFCGGLLFVAAAILISGWHDAGVILGQVPDALEQLFRGTIAGYAVLVINGLGFPGLIVWAALSERSTERRQSVEKWEQESRRRVVATWERDFSRRTLGAGVARGLRKVDALKFDIGWNTTTFVLAQVVGWGCVIAGTAMLAEIVRSPWRP